MKVLVVEDQEFIHNSIEDVLFYSKKDIHVDFSNTPDHAIELLKISNFSKNSYSMVITDLQFENGYKSFEVIDFCFANNIPVLVFSMFENFSIIDLSLSKGANGYISKYDSVNHIIDGFKMVINNEKYLSPRIQRVLKKDKPIWNPHPLVLTNTEHNLLQCLSSGMSMKQISNFYGIQENTLRAHRRNMMQRNNCSYEKLLACFYEFPPKSKFNGFKKK